jgi:hypothetical protein
MTLALILIAPIGILFLIVLVSGTLAYRYRSRQMRATGQVPPSYLVYLFRPFATVFATPVTTRVSIPKPMRILLGLVILPGGFFFLLIAFLLFTSDHAMQSHPIAAVVAGALVAALGAAFAYVGFRLIVASDEEQLFWRKGKERDAA